jgi:hypothetical protein
VRYLIAAGVAAVLLASAPLEAQQQQQQQQQQRPRPTQGTVAREREPRPPRPDDKSLNEGAQGRRNATEDASRASQGPWNERGFLEGAGSYY